MNELKQEPAQTQVLSPHISVNPHIRGKLSTREAMLDVALSLMPATVVGIWVNGLHAALIVAASVITAVLTEFIFDYIAKRGNTVRDNSAIVTGLLLALCLPAGAPLYVPILGSIFAILVVKCLFGGLGKNFMNPALAARCFLMISFSSAMTRYSVDGVSTATTLAILESGEAVSVSDAFYGLTSDVIGGSVLAMMIGGFYLWIIGGITIHIPASVLASFTLFVGIFGGHGFDPAYLAVHLCGGGIIMGAIFMATDPVTSPANPLGQVVYGTLIGIMSGIFRVYGSAQDSVSYAIITANLFVPLIDEFIVPKPYALRHHSAEPIGQGEKKKSFSIPKPVIVLGAITILAGLALSGVYAITKEPIAYQQLQTTLASYREVLPEAEEFDYDDTMSAAITELNGGVYGTDFGKAYINEAVVGKSGDEIVGYVISATSGEGMEGDITISVGIRTDGTVVGIAYTVLNETAGLGSLCGEPAFMDQFAGVNTDRFELGGSGENGIDGVSGATISSTASVNAVNAALDFFATYAKGGE